MLLADEVEEPTYIVKEDRPAGRNCAGGTIHLEYDPGEDKLHYEWFQVRYADWETSGTLERK